MTYYVGIRNDEATTNDAAHAAQMAHRWAGEGREPLLTVGMEPADGPFTSRNVALGATIEETRRALVQTRRTMQADGLSA